MLRLLLHFSHSFIFTGTRPLIYRFPVFALALFLGTVACGGGGARKPELSRGECLRGEIAIEGEAPIYTDKNTALNKAREDACRKAIETCIGVQVAGETQTMEGESIANEIFTRSSAICRDYQLLDQTTYRFEDVNMIKATYRFRVSRVEMNDRIDTALKLVGNPKVMILIREVHNLRGARRVFDFADRGSVTGITLRDFLVEKGYTIIDPQRAGGGSLAPGVVNALESAVSGETDDIPGLSSFKDRAAQAGADVLVIGQVETNPQNISVIDPDAASVGIKSYQATGGVTVLALWGKGKVLGQFYERQPVGGAHTTDLGAARESIKRFTIGAARNPMQNPGRLVVQLHERLTRTWGRLTRNNEIVMKVRGLNRDQMGWFRDDLLERTAVRNIVETSFAGDSGEFEVTYPGRAFALSDTLAFYSDNPRVFPVVARSGKKIYVDLVRRGEIHVSFR